MTILNIPVAYDADGKVLGPRQGDLRRGIRTIGGTPTTQVGHYHRHYLAAASVRELRTKVEDFLVRTERVPGFVLFDVRVISGRYAEIVYAVVAPSAVPDQLDELPLVEAG